MADDERLREALLELKVLRDREARRLEDTQALLSCFQAYAEAPDPEAALASIFGSLRQTIQAVATLVVERAADGAARIVATDAPRLQGHTLGAPVQSPTRWMSCRLRARENRSTGAADLTGFGGLMICPVTPDVAVLVLRGAGARFTKSDLSVFERLAALAVQAHRNAQVANEKTLLAAAIDGSSSGIAIADAQHPDLPLVYVNPAFEALSGYSSAEALEQNCRFLAADAPDAPERQRIREAVARRASGTFLLRNRRKSGELFWNELALFPVHGSGGAVTHLVATQSDVTAHHLVGQPAAGAHAHGPGAGRDRGCLSGA